MNPFNVCVCSLPRGCEAGSAIFATREEQKRAREAEEAAEREAAEELAAREQGSVGTLLGPLLEVLRAMTHRDTP